LKDNGITRQRFWGTPAPIWECSCGGIEVIGSEKELKEKAIGKLPENLHKPWIDNVKLKCPKCKKEMERIPDVIDVWIDSGTVSWNCLHYPEKKEYFDDFFPADLILEASEQAHLWFSMLQICSTIMFNKSCYNGVFGHGMILDFQGTKMSKSLGNIISPYEVIDKYSSEILRYYICETRAGENINFNWEDVEQKRRNLIILINTANYLKQLDGKEDKKIGLEEKFLFSRLNSAIKKVTELFDNYRFDETITELEKFYLDISRVYIKLVRDKSLENPGVVFFALKEVYVSLLKMFSTICPIITESIWKDLREKRIVKEESIHLCEFPKANEKLINEKLEKEFYFTLKIIELGLAERDKEKIGLKWPLAKAIITSENKISKEIQEIIARQLNVKKIEIKKGKEISVKLDTKITEELESEGYAREISRAIQAERKKLGLIKTEYIDLTISLSSSLLRRIKTYENFLKERVNAKKIFFTNSDINQGNELKIKEEKLKIFFKKV
jgi:isoleucyl-tRNA synthetase